MLTPAQLAARCGKLGGSDIASLFGCGFQTKRELWLKKKREIDTGEVVQSEASWIMERGNALEVPVLQWWAAKNKRMVVLADRDTPPLTNADHPWAIGSLDAWVNDFGLLLPVDAKIPTNWSRKDWEDGAPRKYVLQIQFYLWLMGAPCGYLVAAIGDDEPIEVRVDRDDALIAEIVSRGDDFALSLALGDEPSGEDANEAEAIPRTVGLEADGELVERVTEFAKLNPMKADIEKRLDAIKERIVALSTGAKAITIGGTPVVTMVTKETAVTDWKKLNAEHPGLIDGYRLSPKVSVYPTLSRRKP